MKKRRSIIWTTPIEDLRKIVEESYTIKEVIIKLGMKFSPSHYKTFNSRVEEECIDISHFNPYKNRKPSVDKIPLNEILTENSTYSRHWLKRRLIEEGLLEEKCEDCGVGNEWNGKPLSLQLDHKNGVNDDNRIENLRLLCPNCHSQTDTFGSKNFNKEDKVEYNCEKCGDVVSTKNVKHCAKCHGLNNRRAERPSRDIILKQIEELGYVGTGKIYGVSDNAIRKWIK